MKFTDIFIKRPVFAASISLLILLLGIYSIFNLQVREYPKMTNTVVTVTTSYYGADSKLIQGFITQPLEQAIAQADNIDVMTSESFMGTSKITVNMKLNTDPNAALANILAKVNSVRAKLPREAQDPTVEISNGSQSSVMYISFSSKEIDSSQITDYLERVIRPQLYTVEGVAKVNLFGGIQYGLRVWLDPARMGAFGMSAQQVTSVLQANNFQSAVGQSNSHYTILNGSADTQVATAEELKRLIVGNSESRVIRLGDIADIKLEKSRDTYRSLANGNEGVVVAVDTTPSANPLIVAEDIRKLLPTFERNLPSTILMKLLYDRTIAIDESIDEVVMTILEAVVIVVVVITLFMGSFRAVIIPIVTIPLSLVGVAMIMSSFGFSLNLMTLLAMVLAIGLVVDDAIVVVENVDRHLKAGETPFRAAIIGTREIALPVISMTITLAAVYAPIALMDGITGSLFKEFSLTLAGAVFISGIVALTLSPVMCAKLLPEGTKHSKFEQAVNRFLNTITRRYTKLLTSAMNQRRIMVAFALIVCASLPFLFNQIPSELAPKEDKSVLMMMGTAPSSANLDFIQQNMEIVTDFLSQQPETAASLAMIGIPSANQSFGIAPLVPWSMRERSQSEMQKFVGQKVKEVPGLAVATFQMPELPGASSGLPIQLVITSSNSFEQIFQLASQMEQKMNKSPLFIFTQLNLKYDSGTMKLKIKRDMAGSYGITMQDIGTTLATMMSDGYVNRINLEGRSYEVITQVERSLRSGPEALEGYYIIAADGRSVPLSSLVDVEIVPEPRSLPNFNQMKSATISAVATPGVAMGDAIEFAQNLADELPKGYSYNFMGEARQYVSEGNSLFITFGLALAIIFLVLASQFESLRDPLVIMVTVPLAISGALVALGWTHVGVQGLTSMNIYTQVGLITLVGLITKHGILMCEVAKERQLHQGESRIDAIMHAATVRLRPILMTTAAMIAGLIPLLFASGAGAVARFNIGLVIVSGLFIGTLFTLFILPVIYSFIASKHKPIQQFEEHKS